MQELYDFILLKRIQLQDKITAIRTVKVHWIHTILAGCLDALTTLVAIGFFGMTELNPMAQILLNTNSILLFPVLIFSAFCRLVFSAILLNKSKHVRLATLFFVYFPAIWNLQQFALFTGIYRDGF